ncbi:PREDICTED: E3 ubiquitin-protein ligase arih1-like [Camelina sativa]|uniref:RBR-type E3 ubiquitin transferase n=1 Tax=Camelina sativa TaxID=90675 RepID=A0ABM0ZF49_CAMSA|nr:PREDICTED: E3 ubiquitin-protein ligase arih1-like [Camelina sativa]
MAARIKEEDEVSLILEEQREEIMAAKTLDRDQDLAFNLQMQEALAVSRAAHTSSVPESSYEEVDFTGGEDEEFDFTALILQDIERAEQERRDREFGEHEMKRLKVDLDRRIHDQRFAEELMSIPEGDWSKHGDNYAKPYALGAGASSSSSSSAIRGEIFKVYCKGLVSEEMIGDTRVTVGGVGVALCDSTGNLIWEVKKVLGADESKSPEIAELEALVHGLEEALTFELGRVTFFIDNFKVFQYVTRKVEPRHSVVATLVNQVALLQQKFSYCQPSLLARNDVKFVFKLARDAIVSQIKWPEEASTGKTFFKETCVICYEGITVDKMFSVDGCFHRFCFSCMKQHVEVKLLGGQTASCPSEGCKSEVKIECCANFLDPKLVDVMIQRKKEGSISVTDKVYCPYPKCSELMVKSELLEYTKQYFVGAENSKARKCMKCLKFFCTQCKVPWHYDLSCSEFGKTKGYQNAGDGMLKSLAQSKRWRQCIKCNNMVELAWGCYHITCRCGYEFCYTCGAEWKKKKATCSCPIWDERNIIRERNAIPPRR